MIKPIKAFTGILVGTTLGGAAMGSVGGISSMPSNLRSLTQTGIGLGVFGYAAKKTKDLFDFK